jgi:hypothetical protein
MPSCLEESAAVASASTDSGQGLRSGPFDRVAIRLPRANVVSEAASFRAVIRASRRKALDPAANPGKVRRPMANRAIWNVRRRHEWLATPLKSRRVKRATRVRCGLQDALDRKANAAPQGEEQG